MTSDSLRRLIKSKMELYGEDAISISTKLHLTRSAWYKRLEKPERMRFEEMWKLENILHLELINKL